MQLSFTALIALLFSCALSLSAAQLSWDHTQVQLELAPQQNEARASFTATNVSGAVILISKVETSCGCTSSIVNQQRLQPGESSEIIATFHRGKRTSGSTNQLKVYLDNASQPSSTLQFRVDIATPLKATPQVVYWNASSAPTERNVQLVLDARYVDSIEAINYDAEKITLIREPGSDVNSGFVLRILPKSFDQVLRETITITAQGPANKADTKVLVFVQP
jgi:hypothetical protein